MATPYILIQKGLANKHHILIVYVESIHTGKYTHKFIKFVLFEIKSSLRNKL